MTELNFETRRPYDLSKYNSYNCSCLGKRENDKLGGCFTLKSKTREIKKNKITQKQIYMPKTVIKQIIAYQAVSDDSSIHKEGPAIEWHGREVEYGTLLTRSSIRIKDPEQLSSGDVLKAVEQYESKRHQLNTTQLASLSLFSILSKLEFADPEGNNIETLLSLKKELDNADPKKQEEFFHAIFNLCGAIFCIMFLSLLYLKTFQLG